MNIKRSILIILFLLSGLILGGCNEEARTRNAILQDTPIGATMDNVVSYCVANELKCQQSLTAGYLNQKTGKTIGVKSIWATLGEHKSLPLLNTTIAVYWGFDKEGNLVDIWVWKVIEGP